MSTETGWEAATWEGSRRAQIRRALRLSVRERLEALEALSETSARLAQSAPRDGAGRDSETESGPGHTSSVTPHAPPEAHSS